MTKPLDLFRAALLNQDGLLLFEEAPSSAQDTFARKQTALTFLMNLEGLGFALDRGSFGRLSEMSIPDQSALNAVAWPLLLQSVGAHRTYKPMYPNFPKQVVEASDAELFFNAILHYTGDAFGVRIMPNYPESKRPSLRDKHAKPKPLSLTTLDQAFARLGRWLNATQAYSPAQVEGVRAGLAFALETDSDQFVALIKGTTLSNRENRAVVAAVLLSAIQDARSTDAVLAAKLSALWPLPGLSVNDILRASVALSGGDVSLAEPTKFKSFPRPLRRDLVQGLNAAIPTTQTSEEDVFLRREVWLRLGEKLHPGEFETKAPLVFSLFDAVRNRKAPVSLMGRLDKFLEGSAASADMAELRMMFIERPGALARQLHRLLLWSEDRSQEVVAAFAPVANQCATSLLLTLAHHFATQADRVKRTVLPKGSLGKMLMTEHVPQAVVAAAASALVDLSNQALVARFAHLPALGKCFVDPALEGIPTPFALRSASKALKTVPRGSKVPMEDADHTRMFLWWGESDPEGKLPSVGRIDIDLSCVVLSQDFKVVSSCTYYDLRGQGLTHSGDITSAPRGACEFVDIDHKALPKNARFVVMSINSYTEQAYADVPECFAGFMPRQSPKKGEIFEPRTVANRFDLTSDSKGVIPLVIDLKNKCVIWADMPYSGSNPGVNNVLTHKDAIRRTVEGLMNLSRPTMGELFRLHATARGTLVDTKEEADTVFSLSPQGKKPGVNAYQALEILSDWQVEAEAVVAAPKATGKRAKVK